MLSLSRGDSLHHLPPLQGPQLPAGSWPHHRPHLSSCRPPTWRLGRTQPGFQRKASWWLGSEQEALAPTGITRRGPRPHLSAGSQGGGGLVPGAQLLAPRPVLLKEKSVQMGWSQGFFSFLPWWGRWRGQGRGEGGAIAQALPALADPRTRGTWRAWGMANRLCALSRSVFFLALRPGPVRDLTDGS